MDVFHVHTALLAMFLSVIIMIRGSWYNKSNLYLGAHFMVTAFGVLVFCFGYKGDSLFWTTMLMGQSMPFYFLVGPLAFFYVRSVLTDQAKLSKLDYLHFLIFFIQVLFMLPYWLTSWEHKLSIAQAFQNGDTRQLTLNLSLIPGLVNSFLGMLHVFCYLVLIAYTWWKCKKNHEIKSFNNLSFKFTNGWLILFFSTAVNYLINTFFISLSSILTPSRSEFMASFPGFVKYTAVAHLIILGGLLSFPEIMYGIPRIRAHVIPEDSEPQQKIEVVNEKEVKLPVEIVLHPNRLQFPEIDQKLESVVHHTKSFLAQDFTIYKLAIEVGIPVHHLRFYFTNSGLSFTNFKNRLRINYAITILNSGERDKFSIEGIGRHAGFTSSASFFTEFKKETGLTPTEYTKRRHDVA